VAGAASAGSGYSAARGCRNSKTPVPKTFGMAGAAARRGLGFGRGSQGLRFGWWVGQCEREWDGEAAAAAAAAAARGRWDLKGGKGV
jgi:hypothetical protein